MVSEGRKFLVFWFSLINSPLIIIANPYHHHHHQPFDATTGPLGQYIFPWKHQRIATTSKEQDTSTVVRTNERTNNIRYLYLSNDDGATGIGGGPSFDDMLINLLHSFSVVPICVCCQRKVHSIIKRIRQTSGLCFEQNLTC